MIELRRTLLILSLVISFFIATPVLTAASLTNQNLPGSERAKEKIDTNPPIQPRHTLKIEAKVTKAESDYREQTLYNFLTKRKSPLAVYTRDFIEIADKYNLDYRFLPAIAGLESSWGQALLQNSHNPFGWGGGRIYFKSFPEAFVAVAQGIRTRYVPTGKVTPQLVGPTYAATPTWASRVTGFMVQIENSPI